MTSDLVRQHWHALHVSSELTRWFRRVREPHVKKVTVEGVLAALHREGINPVLLGTHGLNVYRSETRATQDVDVLVTKREVRKAVRILEEEYPYLEIRETSVVARFIDPVSQKPLIDVIKPASRAMQMVFRHSIKVGKSHRIPKLEMAIACKLVAMIAPNRQEAEKTCGPERLHRRDSSTTAISSDIAKLKHWPSAVYPRGGAVVLQIVADIDAGRDVRL